MSGLAELFAGENFKGTMHRYCALNDWRIADLNDRRLILKFTMTSGRKQTLFVIKYDATLEFSVPSMAAFETESQIPHSISTLLLKRNAEQRIGFWCIEKIGNKYVYSSMHNAEMQLIDSDYFARVVRTLIRECDDFEGILLEIMK